MKHPVLGLLFLGIGQLALAQTPTDQLHRRDRSVMPAVVDEIGETEVTYFRPGDATRTARRIARAQLWKIVFSNGETEVFNTPLPEQAVVSAEPPPPAVTPVSPTDSLPRPRRRDTFFTLHVGGVLPELHRGGAASTSPFSDDRFLSYRAGFSIEAVARRHYGVRIELGYVRRGGHETFAAANGYTVRSTTTLHYVQASVFPVILKAGSPRLRGFVGLGGYAAWLAGHGQKYAVNGSIKGQS